MPVFKVDIQMQWRNEFFTNVYHLNVDTLGECEPIMDQMATIHGNVLPPGFGVVSGRISTLAEGDATFISKSYAISGSRPFDGNVMPIWNRFLVSFNVGPTYLCRKFLPGVCEGDQIDGGVVVATLNQIQTLYTTPMLNLAALCSPSGAPFLTGQVKPALAMRQLRRRKKRTTPVIPV